jgi:hypothetical protein
LPMIAAARGIGQAGSNIALQVTSGQRPAAPERGR